MTVIEYCRHETKVHELVIIREGGYERCVAYIDCEDLFRLPPDIAHADVIDFSRDHIKVLDHQGTYVSVPCTCLDIKQGSALGGSRRDLSTHMVFAGKGFGTERKF